ncbi:hypothetical protein P7C70_g1085, partial [Phenoliferia sp. Uapishka_3]
MSEDLHAEEILPEYEEQHEPSPSYRAAARLESELRNHPHLSYILTPEAFNEVKQIAFDHELGSYGWVRRVRDDLFPANPAGAFEELIKELEIGGVSKTMVDELKARVELVKEACGFDDGIALNKSAQAWVRFWDRALNITTPGEIVSSQAGEKDEIVSAAPPEGSLEDFFQAATSARRRARSTTGQLQRQPAESSSMVLAWKTLRLRGTLIETK